MFANKQDLLFFLIVLFLSSWHLDNSLGDNTASRAAMVAAIVEDGSLCIDAYEHLTNDKALVDGHYYSEKAPLPALLVVPFHWMARTIGIMPEAPPGEFPTGLVPLSGFLCGSLPFALLVLLAYSRIRRTSTFHLPMTAAVVAFFGSFLFIYSGSFFGHLPAALFTVLAWLDRERGRAFYSGLLSGSAVLCEYSLFVFPLVWLVQDLLRSRGSSAVRFAAGGLPALLILFALDHAITGDPFTLPYSRVAGYEEERGLLGIIAPSWKAVTGLTWGSYRGLLWYAPLASLCLLFILRQQRTMVQLVMHPLVIPSLLLYLMISAHTMWWGGWAFGPRHITVIAALLLVAGLPKIPSTRWVLGSFGALGAFGIALSLAAKSTVWGAFPSDVAAPWGDVLLPALRNGNWTTHQWPVMLGLSPGAAAFCFLLIFGTCVLLFIRHDQRQPRPSDAPLPLP